MNINLTLFAQAIVFAAFIWFTVKFIWPYMLRAIETRQKTIADGLAAGEEGRRSLETSSRQAEQAVTQARNRAAEILAQAEEPLLPLLGVIFQGGFVTKDVAALQKTAAGNPVGKGHDQELQRPGSFFS